MATYIAPTARMYGSACMYGSARMYDSASMYGSARMYGSASMHGSARMSDSALAKECVEISGAADIRGDGLITKEGDYLVAGPAISSGRYSTLHRDTKIGWRVNCGCFSGSLDEYKAEIEQTHQDNAVALAQYRGFVAYFEMHMEAVK